MYIIAVTGTDGKFGVATKSNLASALSVGTVLKNDGLGVLSPFVRFISDSRKYLCLKVPAYHGTFLLYKYVIYGTSGKISEINISLYNWNTNPSYIWKTIVGTQVDVYYTKDIVDGNVTLNLYHDLDGFGGWRLVSFLGAYYYLYSMQGSDRSYFSDFNIICEHTDTLPSGTTLINTVN